ncbi:homeobox protein CDX-2-like [Ixodes scapularis]|uniref:homeobox protein CDX-2-like n=1 Tax=Ixodes scapularis TaxID=6945 RepID=UPI001A9FCF26|nr:homeobox protein CDX-2-like [Ixodes scapularis]
MDENDVSDSRVRYTDHQLQKLEEIFSEHAFINGDQAALLSRELGISLKQTRTWFQNRRAKLRRRAIKAEGKNYVPKLSPGPIRICRTPPSPSSGTGKVVSAAGPRDGVLKPSNGRSDSQMLNVPSFSSRSLSDSPVLSSADEDDVFLCVSR